MNPTMEPASRRAPGTLDYTRVSECTPSGQSFPRPTLDTTRGPVTSYSA